MDTSKLTSKEILEVLRRELNGEAEKPDAGFKTSAQWAAEWGLSRERAGEIIRNASDAGLMESKSYRTLTYRGQLVRPVPHYAYRGKANPRKLPTKA